MAGNRLQRTGSIFERLSGILRAGAIKEQDKPIWYDIYKAFPPKHEPTYSQPPVDKDIKPIYYPEDIIRAKFLNLYGSASIHNLLNPKEKPLLQKFVEKYQELEKSRQYSCEDDIFHATESALEKEGYSFLRRKKTTKLIEGSS